MPKSLVVGTRGSILALWQADRFASAWQAIGGHSERKIINTFGDQNTQLPVYAYGVEGVFTKALDAALLNDEIDVAVHSLKDVPTILAQGLVLAAVLERGKTFDLLVKNPKHIPPSKNEPWRIATGSLRRQAMWRHRYPNTEFSNLRGNMQTRLAKLEASDWHGAIMAEAALDRLELLNQYEVEVLDWMTPPPSQGAIGLLCREDDQELIEQLAAVNVEPFFQAAFVERQFMRQLQGGCAVPLGAYAQVHEQKIHLRAEVLSLDGKQRLLRKWEAPISDINEIGITWAQEIAADGASAILQEIRKEHAND
ncbi:MAG: hydroxymethylbilane synthase [Bacteroidota bacterium]